MTRTVWFKAAALWSAILLLAVLNGILRERMLISVLGSFAGLIASGAILSISIFLVAFVAVPWFGPAAFRQWLRIGLFWLLLTLLFEFSFGRLIQHKTWAELFDAYTFRGGNLWPVVLAFVFISPWLAARIRGFVHDPGLNRF